VLALVHVNRKIRSQTSQVVVRSPTFGAVLEGTPQKDREQVPEVIASAADDDHAEKDASVELRRSPHCFFSAFSSN